MRKFFLAFVILLFASIPIQANPNSNYGLIKKVELWELQATHYISLADNAMKSAQVAESKAHLAQEEKKWDEVNKWKKKALSLRKKASGYLTKASTRIEQSNQLRAKFLRFIGEKEPDKFIIGSWNIQNFGDSKMQKKISYQGKDRPIPEVIAEIIKKLNFAVVALQEIEGDDLDPIYAVLDYLNKDGDEYKMTYPEKLGESSNRAEYLPIVYNSRLLKLERLGHIKNYDMQRDPHYAKFSLRSESFQEPQEGKKHFDFILVSVHLAPKQSGEEDEPRRNDFKALPKVVRWLEKKFGEKDILVAGDFNCDPTTSRGSDYELWEKIRKKIGPVHPFKKVVAGEEIIMTDSMSHGDRLNDNLIWQAQSEKDWTGQKQIYDMVQEYFGGEISLAKEVSDHMPVWAEFYANRDED